MAKAKNNPVCQDRPDRWLIKWFEANKAKVEKAIGLKVLGEILCPLGCGSFGCVYRTSDPKWLVKISSDPTEGPLVAQIVQLRRDADKRKNKTGYGPSKAYDGIVFFRNVYKAAKRVLNDDQKRVPVFVIVREDITPFDTPDVRQMPHYKTAHGVKTAIDAARDTARRFYEVTDQELLDTLATNYVRWLEVARPVAPEAVDTMLQLLVEKDMILADVHAYNVGRTNHNWGSGYRRLGAVVIHDLGYTPTEHRAQYQILNPCLPCLAALANPVE